MKKKVKFEVTVTFEADSDKALKEAIREYKQFPCFESWSFGTTTYSWKESKHKEAK